MTEKKHLQSWLFCALCVVLTSVTGCGGGIEMTPVEGAVTIDGKPLQQGAITFEPVDGMGPSAGALIADGRYEAKAPPGEKKVRITGFEVIGQEPSRPGDPNSPKRDVVKELVPAKYNANSELTLTVEPSDTTGDFELKSS